MLLRCTLDGLLLEAHAVPGRNSLMAFDADEAFEMERVEATHYELVAASPDELRWLEFSGYRLLRRASDFELTPWRQGA